MTALSLSQTKCLIQTLCSGKWRLHKCVFISFLQMTLADYSVSNVAFDRVEKWKETLEYLVTSCNQTEALGAMIPQLEEFIDVARSELVCMTHVSWGQFCRLPRLWALLMGMSQKINSSLTNQTNHNFVNIFFGTWRCGCLFMILRTVWNKVSHVVISFVPESWLATTIFASLNSVAYTLHVLACYR